jgi:two-component system sensor histidine kinase YesM
MWKNRKLNTKFTVIIVCLVLIPIIVFLFVLFSYIEKYSIQERLRSMEYSMEQGYEEVIKSMESINMSSQFFLKDEALMEYLEQVARGDEISYEELLSFYQVNVTYMERMIYNNPYLYQVRIYVDSNSMEEMMPILYRQDRMERLSWGNEANPEGWQFDYEDTIFDSYVLNQNRKILSYVTSIEDFTYGRLGILETAVTMETMFPGVYEEDGAWKCGFLDGNGVLHCRDEIREVLLAEIPKIQEKVSLREDNLTEYLTIDGEPAIIGIRQIKELEGTLFYVDPLTDLMGNIRRNRNISMALLCVISALLILVINQVVKRLLRQFYSILSSIREVQKGNLQVEIANCGKDEMGELGLQINKMLRRIRRLMEDNVNREVLTKNAEIRALQNQINAHFIYNVLESIKMMAEIDEKYELSDAITALGKLLRYSMRWTSRNVTIAEELDYIRNYLILANLRFDYEIFLSLNLPEVILGQEIPKMSLQPIIENAICHGIEEIAQDTSIYVKGFVEGEDCLIEITDAGRGMSEEQVARLHRKLSGEIETEGGSGNGIGLKNVQDRLQMNFGKRYGITISSKLGCYTKIQVRVPFKGSNDIHME